MNETAMTGDAHRVTPEQAERLHRFAHDIRNRLTGIREVLRHLGQPTPDIDTVEMATFGEQQFFKALREVESLLDDMHVERGIGALNKEILDPAVVVVRALDGLQHRLTKKEQSVITDLATDIKVSAHDRCLTDLVTALISNASKFSHRGSTISITLKRTDASAVLRVSDQGVGLSPADLDELFVRYAWLGSRTTEGEAQGRGTLARAAQWAVAHGGALRAESGGTGQGSVFILELPVG
ncbi:MAG TPA: HAMP domain-containing sensor histidine kinase [Flavobacteriales bacterium]|nr:HAMP domain-containing sensor histidine kinase [Flavobacteriales bacterium]